MRAPHSPLRHLARALPFTLALAAAPALVHAVDPTDAERMKPAATRPPAKTATQQKAEIRKTCDAALATLYKAKPAVKAQVAKAPGYGCFSSFGVTLLVGGAGGRGLVHDNASKTDTFMNMGQASAGIDAGIKSYREVIVFHDKQTMDDFVNKGWEVTGSAQASAAAGGKGGTADKSATTGDQAHQKFDVYPMTKTGLSAGISAGARKYWKDSDLN